jgi:hypothetical protein
MLLRIKLIFFLVDFESSNSKAFKLNLGGREFIMSDEITSDVR